MHDPLDVDLECREFRIVLSINHCPRGSVRESCDKHRQRIFRTLLIVTQHSGYDRQKVWHWPSVLDDLVRRRESKGHWVVSHLNDINADSAIDL